MALTMSRKTCNQVLMKQGSLTNWLGLLCGEGNSMSKDNNKALIVRYFDFLN